MAQNATRRPQSAHPCIRKGRLAFAPCTQPHSLFALSFACGSRSSCCKKHTFSHSRTPRPPSSRPASFPLIPRHPDHLASSSATASVASFLGDSRNGVFNEETPLARTNGASAAESSRRQNVSQTSSLAGARSDPHATALSLSTHPQNRPRTLDADEARRPRQQGVVPLTSSSPSSPPSSSSSSASFTESSLPPFPPFPSTSNTHTGILDQCPQSTHSLPRLARRATGPASAPASAVRETPDRLPAAPYAVLTTRIGHENSTRLHFTSHNHSKKKSRNLTRTCTQPLAYRVPPDSPHIPVPRACSGVQPVFVG